MKRILLIRFSALGDVAMLAPIVREVAELNKDCEFTVLSKIACGALFEGLAENVKFIGADVKRDYKGISGLFRLFKEMNKMHFDYVVDMHDVLRTKVLRKFFLLHGYKVYKINKHRELRRIITADGNKKQLRQLPTAFENYRDAIRKISCITVSHNNEISPQDNFKLPSTSSQYKIGIAPFAAHNGKIYPQERMEELISLLSKDNKEGNVNKIFLFGGGDDELSIMKVWADKYDNVSVAADECNGLKDELNLMRELDVMVSMDSANMHLASLVGTRVVSIWGATHPYAGFLGWRQSMDDCVQKNDLKCRPCSIYGNKPCMRDDMACMQIEPKEVVRTIFRY